MSMVGMIPPPEGVVPDFYHWTSLQVALISVSAISFIFATIFLALRLYTAFSIVKKLDWDVLFILVAWGASLVYLVGLVIGRPVGFGRHLWDVTTTQIHGYYCVILLIAITYLWSSTCTKFAMLVLYLRIDPFRTFHICVYSVGFLIAAYTIVFSILLLGPCDPLFVGSGRCINNVIIAQAVLNILSEVAIIILPIPVIHRLNMPARQKVVVGLIMGLGSAMVTISIARIAFVKAMVQNSDVTWTQAESTLFAALELNLGIVCNSMTRLRPFAKAHFPRWRLSMNAPEAPEDRRESSPINGPLSWRGNKESHGYQFRGAESREGFIPGRRTNENEAFIYVTSEYEVSYDSNETALMSENDIDRITRPERDIQQVI